VQVQTAAAAAAHEAEAAAAAAALVHRDQRGKGKGKGKDKDKDKTAHSSAISALAPGQVLRRDPACRVAHVAQHHTEALDARSGISSVDYCADRFKCSSEDARARLGKFGITGTTALQPMSSLSGGQKARVSLTAITWSNPHILLLDEPTNHLDMSALTALAQALRAFDGAIVLISHNREFVTAVCDELWTLDNGTCIALALVVP
jgi:ATP-binding cassette subfamily F protein 3